MATTTNYSWTTPDDTSLVKDGAAAIRSLGTSIDTTTKNLNPSTTLGDIEYRSSSANTNTRLGIGTTGQVLTVAAGVPSWATLSAGGMTQLATGNLSGSAQVRLQSIPGTYKSLVLFVRNQRYTNTNATWGMRLMNDSTANRYASQSSGQSTSETFRYDQVYCTTDLSNTAGDAAIWGGAGGKLEMSNLLRGNMFPSVAGEQVGIMPKQVGNLTPPRPASYMQDQDNLSLDKK